MACLCLFRFGSFKNVVILSILVRDMFQHFTQHFRSLSFIFRRLAQIDTNGVSLTNAIASSTSSARFSYYNSVHNSVTA